MGEIHPQQHLLIFTYALQSHLNPVIQLGNCIAGISGACVTLSTSISAHRKMFPNLDTPDQEVTKGPITYVPFSDGYDKGFKRGVDDPSNILSQLMTVGQKSFSSVIEKLNSNGRKVDCIIYTYMFPWAANVAREHGIPSVQFWIQPATSLAICYHTFHGYDAVIAEVSNDPLSLVKLPGLTPLQIRDLPSFLMTPSSDADETTPTALSFIKGSVLSLDRKQPATGHKIKVLVNTFDELEPQALSAIGDLDLIAVGPILQPFPKDNAMTTSDFHLFKPDDKPYIEWLDSKPKKTVVYVSFGSLSVLKKEQVDEILLGLKVSGCPFLWVLRKADRYEGFEPGEIGENGMIVEWCSQVQVLRHASIGCFVTHCGWNSTLESLACGVPMVGVAQESDQLTNAMLIEKVWGVGVRSELNEDGLLSSEELKRCLDLVSGEGEDIRKKVEFWKEKAAEAIGEGGSSYRNLRSFVDEIAKS